MIRRGQVNGLVSILVALALIAPSSDPRAITPEAADPGIEAIEARVELAPAAVDAKRAAPQAEIAHVPSVPSDPAAAAKGSCLRTRGQCRQLTILGIVFATLGLASIGTGIGLLQKPNEPIADEPAFETSYEPPGVVAIGMGVGVLVTGALMIIAGTRAHKLGISPQARRGKDLRWTRN